MLYVSQTTTNDALKKSIVWLLRTLHDILGECEFIFILGTHFVETLKSHGDRLPSQESWRFWLDIERCRIVDQMHDFILEHHRRILVFYHVLLTDFKDLVALLTNFTILKTSKIAKVLSICRTLRGRVDIGTELLEGRGRFRSCTWKPVTSVFTKGHLYKLSEVLNLPI